MASAQQHDLEVAGLEEKLKDQAIQHQTQVSALEGKLAGMKKWYTITIANLKKKTSDNDEERQAKIAELESEVTRLEKRVIHLEVDIEDHNEQMEHLAHLEKDVLDLKEAAMKLRYANEDMVEKHQDEVAEIEEIIEDLADQHQMKVTELEKTILGQADDYQVKITGLETEMKDQAAKLNNEVTTLEKTLKDQRDQHQVKIAEMDAVIDEQAEHHKLKTTGMRKENASLKGRVEHLEKGVSRLSADLVQTEDEVDVQHRMILDLQSTAGKLAQEKKELVDKHQVRVTEMQRTITDMTRQHQVKVQQLQKIICNNDDAHKQTLVDADAKAARLAREHEQRETSLRATCNQLSDELHEAHFVSDCKDQDMITLLESTKVADIRARHHAEELSKENSDLKAELNEHKHALELMTQELCKRQKAEAEDAEDDFETISLPDESDGEEVEGEEIGSPEDL